MNCLILREIYVQINSLSPKKQLREHLFALVTLDEILPSKQFIRDHRT